jgi:hypothetical protein
MSLAHLVQRTEARVAFRAPGPLPKSAALQRQRGDDFETYGRIAHRRTVAQASTNGCFLHWHGMPSKEAGFRNWISRVCHAHVWPDPLT